MLQRFQLLCNIFRDPRVAAKPTGRQGLGAVPLALAIPPVCVFQGGPCALRSVTG